MMDEKGNISYWNKAAETMFGYRSEETIGKNLHALLTPERFHEAHRKGFEHFKKTGESPVVGKTVELWALKKSGEEFPIELSLSVARFESGWNAIGIIRDSSERKKTQELLHQSEEKFRSLVESTSDWIWEVNTDGVYTYVSPKVKELLGYEPEELIGTSPFNLMPSKKSEHIKTTFLELFKNPVPVRGLENTNRCKDGTTKILETNAVPFFDENKNLAGFRGIDRDISERKKAEWYLRESEERYRSLFETMLNGFAYCKMIYEDGKPVDFLYLNVNNAFEEQTGLSNVTGKLVSEVVPGIHESDPELFERYARVASGGGPEQFELYVQSLDMWFFLSVYSPEKEHFIAIFDVITERKKAEQLLEDEVLRRRIMMENSRDGIAVISKNFQVIESNPRFAEMLGYTMEEMLQLHVWDFEEMLSKQELQEHFPDPTNVNTVIETRHRRKDGTVYDAEVSISGAKVNSTPIVFTIVRDITDRKRSETSLYRANRALKTLSAGNMALVRAKNEIELLQKVTGVIVQQAGYSLAVVVYAEDNPQKSITPMAGAGMNGFNHDWAKNITWADTPEGQLPVALAIRSGETQVCHNITCSFGLKAWKETVLAQGYLSNIALPLQNEGKTFGALCIYSSEENAFNEEEIRLLEELAGDLAYGIFNLRTRVKHEEQSHLLRQSLEQSIQTIAATVEARDPYTAGHQRRVAELAVAIARKMKLDEEQIQGIHFAAIIHDLGKIHIPAEILAKPGRLSNIEFMLIQTHPQEGYDILKEVKFPWPIAEAILQHHEKLDGSGYPRGLRGEEICLEARILTVADVVEAMYSHRPYRAAMGIKAALSEIRSGRGSAYDPVVVDACLELFETKKFIWK